MAEGRLQEDGKKAENALSSPRPPPSSLVTRLWVGSVLILLTLGVLLVDQHLAPWYPFLLVLIVGLSLAACRELQGLLGAERSVQGGLCYIGLTLLGTANWVGHMWGAGHAFPAWTWVAVTFTALVLGAFLLEMATFREPGQSVERLARSVWILVYLGLLPSFLAQVRWLTTSAGQSAGTAALALAIFVPKACDIGAYFTGRFLGRHRLTPVLSPKKTWEGAAGGLAAAVAVACALDHFGPTPLLRGQVLLEVGFGLTVGLAGMLGDLAESLIKRDCQKKDAAQTIPGFGGVLDVVDALLFAAPVAYLWLVALN